MIVPAARKLIIFDFDGVIVDSYDEIYDMFVEQTDIFGIPPITTREDFVYYFTGNLFERLITKGATPESIKKGSAHFIERYPSVISGVELFDGIESALRELSNRNILVIVSSNFSNIIKSYCESKNILKYFREIYGADVASSKSAKIRTAIEKFGVDSKNTFYVCDTVGDINEAKGADVVPVAVSWGYQTKEELLASSPAFICEYPADIGRIIKC